jgi:hypothetical protein
MTEEIKKMERLNEAPGARRTIVIDNPLNTGLVFDTDEKPQLMNAFWGEPAEGSPSGVCLHAMTFVSLEALSPELNQQIITYLKEHPLKRDFRQVKL